jgi:hypothetical protein
MLRPPGVDDGFDSLRLLTFLRRAMVLALDSPVDPDQAASASHRAAKNSRTASS